MRYISALLFGLGLHLFVLHAACQLSTDLQCISNACQVPYTYNRVSFTLEANGPEFQFCCASLVSYPVLFGSPNGIPSCICEVAPLSTGVLNSGDLQIYYGEFASQGGCDPTSCSTCCLDAAPVHMWGVYSASTLASSGIEHPDSMSVTASWQCSEEAAPQLKTVSVPYAYSSTTVGNFGAWFLFNDSSPVKMQMNFGYDVQTTVFDVFLATLGSSTACFGSLQFNPLQQVAIPAELPGSWIGHSVNTYTSSTGASQLNGCYRVSSLQFYDDPTIPIVGMGVQVIYVKHDTVTNDMFWASQLSSIMLSAEPITGSTRVQMQLPADPSGVSHTLYATDAPAGSSVATQLITLHGTNSKCNAVFPSRSAAVLLPAVADVRSFALHLYGKGSSGCVVDPLIDNFVVSGATGSCFSWINNKWGVVQFTVGDVGVLAQFEDDQCQNRSTTNTSSTSPLLLSASVGICSNVGEFNGYQTYVLIEYAATPFDALYAINSYFPASSSSSSSSTANSEPQQMPSVSTAATSSSAPFPITTIGLIVGVCVALILALFLGWCCHDTCKSSATVYPASHLHHETTHVNAPEVNSTTVTNSHACNV